MSTRGSGLGKADFARGFSLAFEFVGAVFLFWLFGRLLDNWLGTEPWIQVIGALVGWGGGFLHIYYRLKGEGWQDLAKTRAAAQSGVAAAEGSTGGPAETTGGAATGNDAAGGSSSAGGGREGLGGQR